ncbi:UNVERIFIED_CONTAM: hypothetical protein FKN15_062781 [Acipenser sinensis]
MNTRCPPKCVPSAARFFTLCKLNVQLPQSYSVTLPVYVIGFLLHCKKEKKETASQPCVPPPGLCSSLPRCRVDLTGCLSLCTSGKHAPGGRAYIAVLGCPACHFSHRGQDVLRHLCGFPGQALGRSLASLVVAHRQLWLSQAKVPDTDKTALLDALISPGHTFGPAVEEILQRSQQERKAYQQVAVLLPPCALARGKSSLWHSPQARMISQTVPIPTAPLDDLRHHLQATVAALNWTLPQGKGNAERGAPTQQHSRRQFQGRRPRHPPQQGP